MQITTAQDVKAWAYEILSVSPAWLMPTVELMYNWFRCIWKWQLQCANCSLAHHQERPDFPGPHAVMFGNENALLKLLPPFLLAPTSPSPAEGCSGAPLGELQWKNWKVAVGEIKLAVCIGITASQHTDLLPRSPNPAVMNISHAGHRVPHLYTHSSHCVYSHLPVF